MDNLFDYLIILFFIFSAISSLFKKKPESGKSTQNRRVSKAKPPINYRQNTDYNPFDLGKGKPVATDGEMIKDYDDNKYIEDEFEKSKEWQVTSKSESLRKITPNVPSEEKIESLSTIPISSSIRKRLKEKNSIKESIIISEILSKPKALRYSGKNLYY
ncbi:MAG: hypothetical protein Fur0015_11410 [Ignavibacteriales bacterium]